MTLEEFAAEALGNSDRKGYLSQIENGNRSITPLTAKRLAEALDLDNDVVEPLLFNDIGNSEDVRSLAFGTIADSSTTGNNSERHLEANRLMRRHQFEELMEGLDTGYSEMTRFLLELGDLEISVVQARAIIRKQNND